MRARRMAGQVDAVRIAAEARCVLADPGDGAAHLLGHRHQVPAGLIDVDEVEHDEVSAGVHIEFGGVAMLFGEANPPRAAMHEHLHRRIRLGRREDIEAFDGRRAIGKALGFAQALPHKLAVGDAALANLRVVRRIDRLIVGVVERLLVHVEPDDRTFFASRRCRLRQRRAAGHSRRCRNESSPRQPLEHFRRHNTHLIRQTRFICSSTAAPSRLSGLPIASAISK